MGMAAWIGKGRVEKNALSSRSVRTWREGRGSKFGSLWPPSPRPPNNQPIKGEAGNNNNNTAQQASIQFRALVYYKVGSEPERKSCEGSSGRYGTSISQTTKTRIRPNNKQ